MISHGKHLRYLISKAIRDSKKPKVIVASELSELVGESVTASQLSEFTREPRPARAAKVFPGEWIAPLAKVTSSHELERHALCQQCRDTIVVGEGVVSYKRHRREEKASKKRK